jgi:thiol:disulfide interchange protein
MAPSSLRRRRFSCAAAIFLLAAPVALAQGLPDFGSGRFALPTSEKVTVTAEFAPAQDDRPALLFVTARIIPGYHVNAMDQPSAADGTGGPQPMAIALAESAPVKLAGEFVPLQPPTSHIDTEGWPGLELREHAREVTWVAPIELPADADLASLTIEGVITGQACNDAKGVCTLVELTFEANAGEGVPLPRGFSFDAATIAAEPEASAPGAAPAASDRSLWTVALYGILGGLILNLMPCVLPVIGLKILSFAKQGGESRRHILGLNLAYVAGVLAVFMVLATLAALVELGLSSESYNWGELNTFTWFKVSMTALVFAMALAFLGVWEIPIPGFASSAKATELAAQEGPVGAFCMGMFTTLLATPCSGPFLFPVFGYTISQPPIVTYLVFGAVGFGMSLPYLLIGAFPSLVNWLPKPGAWMDTLKQVMGFVLLATVVYLFSTISPEYFLPTLALIFSIWFGCWILGRTPAWAEAAYKRRAWLRSVSAAVILGGASFTLLAPSESVLPWQPYSPEALAAARAQGKTVLVDFTANWCLTCKTNLKFAINRERVRELVEENGVVTLLADWTDRNATIKQALADLNSRSIPLLAIYPADPDADVLILPDVVTQGRVLDALEQAGPSLDVARRDGETQTASRPAVTVASER